MKKQILHLATLALMVSLLLSVRIAQPEQAVAQEDVETLLARATIKGFLTSLTYETYSPTLTNFYLADDVVDSPVAQALRNEQIETFALVDEQWLDDGTFVARATINSDNRILIAEARRGETRWQVVSLAWLDDETTAPAPSANVADLSPTGPTVEVVALGLNVRAGPGTLYPAQGVLSQGDRVTIIGVNAGGDWYQVASDGRTIGWISALPDYVSPPSGAVDAPTVPAPPVPIVEDALILQTKSGDSFYLADSNGANLRYISAGIDPALSPDGTKVAFTRWESGEVGAIWIHDLTSGQEWAVLGEMFQPKSPTWSPDGGKIAVNFQQGGRRDLEEHCQEPGDRIPPDAIDVNIGSETGRICYKLPPDTHWRLRLVDLNIGTFQDLNSATYSYAPTWDPANDWRVVFAASTGLQQLDLNRNEYFPFTTDLRDRGPVFSPDGRQVAVSYSQSGHWEVYTISAADGSRNRLTPSSPLLDEPFNSAAPAWSPDGEEIAFVTDRAGQWEFWVMNADGSNPRPLLPPETAAQLDVEYAGVDERLISWGAKVQPAGAPPALIAEASPADAPAAGQAQQADTPGQEEIEADSLPDGQAADASEPEVLPVTGYSVKIALVLPFVIFIVVALVASGIYSIKNRSG
jgi:Tol biopolymer transport system component